MRERRQYPEPKDDNAIWMDIAQGYFWKTKQNGKLRLLQIVHASEDNSYGFSPPWYEVSREDTTKPYRSDFPETIWMDEWPGNVFLPCEESWPEYDAFRASDFMQMMQKANATTEKVTG